MATLCDKNEKKDSRAQRQVMDAKAYNSKARRWPKSRWMYEVNKDRKKL